MFREMLSDSFQLEESVRSSVAKGSFTNRMIKPKGAKMVK